MYCKLTRDDHSRYSTPRCNRAAAAVPRLLQNFMAQTNFSFWCRDSAGQGPGASASFKEMKMKIEKKEKTMIGFSSEQKTVNRGSCREAV